LEEVLGLALVRTGNKGAGLKECEAAWSAVASIRGPAERLDAGAALIEARIESGDREGALRVFHEIEPLLTGSPELQWRTLALTARADPGYLGRAREALGRLSQEWGKSAYNDYLTRPDIDKLSRPLLHLVSAIH
jgi:hypothetical protein